MSSERDRVLELMSTVADVESKARAISRLVKSPRFMSLFMQANEAEQNKMYRYAKSLDLISLRHVLNGVPMNVLRDRAALHRIPNYSRLSKIELKECLDNVDRNLKSSSNDNISAEDAKD